MCRCGKIIPMEYWIQICTLYTQTQTLEEKQSFTHLRNIEMAEDSMTGWFKHAHGSCSQKKPWHQWERAPSRRKVPLSPFKCGFCTYKIKGFQTRLQVWARMLKKEPARERQSKYEIPCLFGNVPLMVPTVPSCLVTPLEASQWELGQFPSLTVTAVRLFSIMAEDEGNSLYFEILNK